MVLAFLSSYMYTRMQDTHEVLVFGRIYVYISILCVLHINVRVCTNRKNHLLALSNV